MAPQPSIRQLGKSGPPVSALGFGAMGLSAFYGSTEPDAQRFQVLDRAHALGQTFWDTADSYRDNEDLIGNWFCRTGKRSEIFLATKFGNQYLPDGSRVIRSDPDYVQEACERSLKRLGIGCIDLYYCHRVDGKTPIEKTVEAMVKLKKSILLLPSPPLTPLLAWSANFIAMNSQGKIRHLGLSEVSATTLRRAHAVHPIAALQIEYSPFFTAIETPQIDLLQTCRALGVAIVAYSPLGRGFLTAQYQSRADFEEGDFRLAIPRFSEENFPKNLDLVDKLEKVARRKDCTPSQLTLAWLLAQGHDIIPIPGTKRIKYLEENWASLEVALTGEEEEEVRRAIESVEIEGERYPEVGMRSLFANTPDL